MNYQELIKPELLILIPVLYFVGMGIKKSAIKDNYIPFILGGMGVLLSGIYLFSLQDIIGLKAVASALFYAITQGILCAAASVYSNQLYKQAKELKESAEKDENKKD